MLEYFKINEVSERWQIIAKCACLVGGIILLFWIFGGFPPHPWLFLGQAIGQLPGLWAARGATILVPFGLLLLLCLALFLGWGSLLFAAWKMAQSAWYYYREQRRFAREVREAEFLALSKMGQTATPAAMARPITPFPETTPDQVPTRPVPPTRASRPSRPALHEFPTQVGVPTNGHKPPEPADISITQQSEYDSLELRVGHASDPGHKRKQKPNEDNLFVMQKKRARNSQPFGIFVIADGMGGHSNGREASRLAIQSFGDIVIPSLVNSVETDDEYFVDVLVDGLQHANLLLHQHNRAQNADMGTTITTALLIGATAYVANVGDSRTYIYRPGAGLTRVTQDHSVVERLVSEGAITPDEVYTHPKRNQIYRCMGEKAAVEADSFAVSIQAGDKLLLCSDGLWEMVRDPQIEQILAIDVDPAQTSKYLIQAALDGGGDDNVSAIVVQIMQAPN